MCSGGGGRGGRGVAPEASCGNVWFVRKGKGPLTKPGWEEPATTAWARCGTNHPSHRGGVCIITRASGRVDSVQTMHHPGPQVGVVDSHPSAWALELGWWTSTLWGGPLSWVDGLPRLGANSLVSRTSALNPSLSLLYPSQQTPSRVSLMSVLNNSSLSRGVAGGGGADDGARVYFQGPPSAKVRFGIPRGSMQGTAGTPSAPAPWGFPVSSFRPHRFSPAPAFPTNSNRPGQPR